jgi:hypothetical protein
MNVVVPFVALQPVVKSVLESYKLPFIDYVHLPDDDAYRRLLQRIWHSAQETIIVEHDILPWPGALEELSMCPCRWGTYSYRTLGGTGIAHMLGCAKLGEGLMRELPGIWDAPGHWSELDQRLFFAARDAGIEPHLHRPPVIHLNPRDLR